MTQPNDADIVRVYTRQSGGSIENLAPNLTTGGNQFEVVVEAEAGTTRAGGTSSYGISLTAFDITAGQSAAVSVGAPMNPGTLNQTFQTTAAALPPQGSPAVTGASNITPWAAYEEKFVIALTAAQAANAAGHVFQYTAVLQTASVTDPIVSIVQSPPFILVV